MKHRHIWTASSTKRKSIGKMLKDPKFGAKLKDLSELVTKIEEVNGKLKRDKIDNLHDWVLRSIQNMSDRLYEQVKSTGFIERLMELVTDETESKTNNGEIYATIETKEKTENS